MNRLNIVLPPFYLSKIIYVIIASNKKKRTEKIIEYRNISSYHIYSLFAFLANMDLEEGENSDDFLFGSVGLFQVEHISNAFQKTDLLGFLSKFYLKTLKSFFKSILCVVFYTH